MFGVNPYSPYGYPSMGFPQGQGGPQTPFGGQGMSQPAQPQQAAQSGFGVLQVTTIKQVEQVNVPAGGKVLVLVQNDPVIAMRVADQMGLVSTSYYHIEQFDPDAAAAAAAAPQLGDFVTRAEFEQFAATFGAGAKTGKQKREEAAAE